jgi:hypothetical protein
MKARAAERSRAQRRPLEEYLSGRPFGTELPNPISKSAFFINASGAGPPRDVRAGPAWNGWGATITNSRFDDQRMIR